MEVVAPLGGVYQAGTLSGNPIAMQAGLTTLELVEEPGFYEALERRSAELIDGLQALADEAGVPFSTNRVGSMFGFFFAEAKPVTTFLQAKNGDNKMFRDFFLAMLRQGINLAPSPFESGFISAAHEDEEIKKTLNAANFAFKELAS
jgi:glutamate-1-semialdehyde 2,1-aminomutase